MSGWYNKIRDHVAVACRLDEKKINNRNQCVCMARLLSCPATIPKLKLETVYIYCLSLAVGWVGFDTVSKRVLKKRLVERKCTLLRRKKVTGAKYFYF